MRNNSRNRRRNKANLHTDINLTKTRNILIIIICILLIIFTGVIAFNYLKNKNDYKNLVETSKQEIETEKQEEQDSSNNVQENQKEETDTTFTLTAIGDVMCHNTQYIDAYDSDTGTYDFSYVFDNISSYTKTADICVASLETSFAGKERRI